MQTVYRFVLLLATTAIVIGCGGGTTTPQPTPQPPVITTVTPADAGAPGESVTFRATATNNPTSWEWTFGDGTTPPSSTEATPVVELGALGTYSGTVRATNGNGTSVLFAFSYRVVFGLPRVVAVIPDGALGSPEKQVTFSVIAFGDPTSFEWNFGEGATPRTSTEKDPLILLGEPGTYAGQLAVRNTTGSSMPFAFEYTVNPPLPTPITGVNPRRATDSGESQLFTALGDFAIGPEQGTLRWTFAEDEVAGQQDRAEIEVNLGLPGWRNGSVQLVTSEGVTKPVAFEYLVERPGDPPLVHTFRIDGIDGPNQDDYRLGIVDGRPAAAVYTHLPDTKIRQIELVQALTQLPVSPADWRTTIVAPLEGWAVIEELETTGDGRPTVVSGHWTTEGRQIDAYTSSSDNPTGPGDWILGTLPVPKGVDQFSFGTVAGRSVFAANSREVDHGKVTLGLSSINGPSHSADWQTQKVRASLTGSIEPATDIVEHEGRIALGLTENMGGPFRIMLAKVSSPTTTSDWSMTEVLDKLCWRTSIHSVNGHLQLIHSCAGDRPSVIWLRCLSTEPAGPESWVQLDTEVPSGFPNAVVSDDKLVLSLAMGHLDDLPSTPAGTGIAWIDPVTGVLDQDWRTAFLLEGVYPTTVLDNNGTILIAVRPY